MSCPLNPTSRSQLRAWRTASSPGLTNRQGERTRPSVGSAGARPQPTAPATARSVCGHGPRGIRHHQHDEHVDRQVRKQIPALQLPRLRCVWHSRGWSRKSASPICSSLPNWVARGAHRAKAPCTDGRHAARAVRLNSRSGYQTAMKLIARRSPQWRCIHALGGPFRLFLSSTVDAGDAPS